MASELGAGGQQLAAAVHEAFATGLGDAMRAGAVLAVAAAAFVAWRAPGRTPAALADITVPAVDLEQAA